MERWAAVDAEDTHLARIRIYEADPTGPNPYRGDEKDFGVCTVRFPAIHALAAEWMTGSLAALKEM